MPAELGDVNLRGSQVHFIIKGGIEIDADLPRHVAAEDRGAQADEEPVRTFLADLELGVDLLEGLLEQRRLVEQEVPLDADDRSAIVASPAGELAPYVAQFQPGRDFGAEHLDFAVPVDVRW